MTEITHRDEGRTYAHGGGFVRAICDPGEVLGALVARTPGGVYEELVPVGGVAQGLDYQHPLRDQSRGAIRDTVILRYRTPMYRTRSWNVAVMGLHHGHPEVAGVFDHAATMVDPTTMTPLPLGEGQAQVPGALDRYRNEAGV